jgi:hypothetical protein
MLYNMSKYVEQYAKMYVKQYAKLYVDKNA